MPVMASLPPRIHGFSDLSESFSLIDNFKRNVYDAYLVATCRVENRVLGAGERLDNLTRSVHAAGMFFPGREYPHRGAKPRGVQFCGVPLEATDGPTFAHVRTTQPIDLPIATPLRWKVAEDDGVPAWDSEDSGAARFPEVYVWTRAPEVLPVAAACDIEATVERAMVGGSGMPVPDLLSLSIAYFMPGEDRPSPAHTIRQMYPGPIEGDMYVLATRLEKLFEDQPPYHAPGRASVVARSIRYGEVLMKVPGGADQRWRLVSVVEAELPVEWQA